MLSKKEIKQVKQLEVKKHRQEEGLFVAEGPKVVGDLLRNGFRPAAIYATPDFVTPVIAGITNITADELRRISFLQHPQQVVGVFHIPQTRTLPAPHGLCLALDGVQDPGNLGTIIRIADWFGIDCIYCSPDTADAWNPKVVQATMGSIARVNIYYINIEQLLQSTALPVYGTLLDGDSIYAQPLTEEGIIVMGNEGNGISQAVRPLIAHKLFIPSYREGDRAESLNVSVATAVVCAEFRRRKGITE
jgi:TrmH family RNA methyltransferase